MVVNRLNEDRYFSNRYHHDSSVDKASASGCDSKIAVAQADPKKPEKLLERAKPPQNKKPNKKPEKPDKTKPNKPNPNHDAVDAAAASSGKGKGKGKDKGKSKDRKKFD